MPGHIAANVWLGTIGAGGAGAAARQPNLAFRLVPDPTTLGWRLASTFEFGVESPIMGDVSIRTNHQNVANITLAELEADLDCSNPTYTLDREDAESLWARACTIGAARIEMVNAGFVERIYEFVVGSGRGYGAGYGPGYG